MSNYAEPSPTMIEFIGAVNAHLEIEGISKSELARRTGIAQPTISALLNGRTGSCQLSTADRIAEALGTTASELLVQNHQRA